MFIILIIVYCYYLLYHHIETPHIVIVSRCVYPANMSNIPHCEVFGRYFSQENSQLVILRNLVWLWAVGYGEWWFDGDLAMESLGWNGDIPIHGHFLWKLSRSTIIFWQKKTDSSWDTSEVERVGETERNLHCSLTEIVISLIIICMMYNVCLCCVYIIYIYIYFYTFIWIYERQTEQISPMELHILLLIGRRAVLEGSGWFCWSRCTSPKGRN